MVGLWRQGPFAPFFARARPSQTVRMLETQGHPLAGFGFVVPREDEEKLEIAEMVGPRPAIAILMIEDEPGEWRVWGQPRGQEIWTAARRVELWRPPVGHEPSPSNGAD